MAEFVINRMFSETTRRWVCNGFLCDEKEWVFHTESCALQQTWMGNLKLALCVEKLPTTAQLQLSILNSIPFLSPFLFPLQLLPTAFFHKLGKVHGFNQVFPRRYELEGLQWAIEATASQAMETNSSCESKYTMFRPIFLPSFHFIPCHSVISVMIPYPHPHFASYIPSMCCVVLCSLAGVLSSFDDEDDTSRNPIFCPWLTWNTSTHTRYSIQFTFLIVVLFLCCCSIYWLILCNLSVSPI